MLASAPTIRCASARSYERPLCARAEGRIVDDLMACRITIFREATSPGVLVPSWSVGWRAPADRHRPPALRPDLGRPAWTPPVGVMDITVFSELFPSAGQTP